MTGMILKSLARSWREHFGMQMATLVVLTGTFTVVALFFFFQSNFNRILSQWGDKVQFAVFLSDSASEAQVAVIKGTLESSEQFSEVNFVSKKSAAETFRQQMGTNSPELLSDPEFGNPLPASFEARLKNGMSNRKSYDSLVQLAQSMMTLPGVDDVSYGQGWVENYASLLKVFSSSSWLLISLLVIGSLLIVGNAIRQGVFQRREEIEVLELVGASPTYIRLPFLAEGASLGFTASVLSLGICFALHLWQKSFLSSQLGFWGIASQLEFMGLGRSLTVIALGTWFGLLGSYLCVRHIATGWAAANRD